MRQALAAILRRATHSRPAPLDIEIVGFLEAGRGSHGAVLVSASFAVPALIERLQNGLGELPSFIEHAALRHPGSHLQSRAGPKLSGVENLIHNKAVLIEGRFVVALSFPFRSIDTHE